MPAPAMNSANPVMQLSRRCCTEPLVFDGMRPELCSALEQVILGRMQSDRRKTGSLNVGGWKSAEDLFSWSDLPVQELRGLVVEHVGSSKLVGWAMVNRAGSYHPRHQHLAAIVFGIYYVTSGSEDSITPTVFECGGDGSPIYEMEVDPHPGRLVIARGSMWHKVPAYPGEMPRITVAFDVRR